MKYFKNNEKNKNNAFYYNIDDQMIGNIHENIKYMYPNDNSVILGNKF